MTDLSQRNDGASVPFRKPVVSAESGSLWQTFLNLWPYMWPSDRPDLKRRIIYATFFMVLAKVVTVFMPYAYKLATDALSGELTLDAKAEVWLPALLMTPVALVLLYNFARVVMMGLNQLRDAIFASVGQHAVRQLSTIVFAHLHSLSLRYHLQRRTGGLSRAIERGTKGIEAIVRFTILNGIPTILGICVDGDCHLDMVRFQLCARGGADGRRVHLVHRQSNQLADQHSPRHERK